MDEISKAVQGRWDGCGSRKTCASSHLCLALLIILQIVYTPIHLHQVPHVDDAPFDALGATTPDVVFAEDDHDGDDHRDHRHPAMQHKFKGVSPERLVIGQMELMPSLEWAEPEADHPQPHLFGFSGLSPPELSVSWRFIFRAALPVRAPSFLS